MVILQYAYLGVGCIVCLFLGLLAYSSVRERRSRAIWSSLLLLILFALLWFGWLIVSTSGPIGLSLPLAGFGLLLILFFFPTGRGRVIDSGKVTQRVDERDIMFAREEYEPGTEKYEQYYAMHPELKKTDDRLRRMPERLEPGGRYYDPARADLARQRFAEIRALTRNVEGEVNDRQKTLDPETATAEIRARLISLGAAEVGFARLNPMFVYSHVGRGPEEWGSPINNDHKTVIVYSVEMDYFAVEAAPRLAITEETVRRYQQAADMSIDLARQIRSWGYSARAHISGSNYQIMLPPVAHDAGLGEVGRCGYLISPKHGARIRLGAISTDLPLIHDRPVSIGVQDFCDKCVKCAENCPSSAIPLGNPTDVLGVEKWPLKVVRCLHYWRVVGTDCGLCMKVCPFSHPPTLVHNLVRFAIRRSAIARTLSVWGDDLIYGRKTEYPRV